MLKFQKAVFILIKYKSTRWEMFIKIATFHLRESGMVCMMKKEKQKSTFQEAYQ